MILVVKSSGELATRQVSAFHTTYQYVIPILTDANLKEMGLKPGPQFKKILDRLLDARPNGGVKTELDERQLVQQVI